MGIFTREEFLLPFQWGIKVIGYTYKGRIFIAFSVGYLGEWVNSPMKNFFIPFSVGYLGEWVNSQRKNFLFPFQWVIKVNG